MWFDMLKDSASTFGADIDGLIWLIWKVTAFFFVVMQGLLLYYLWRYRSSRPGRAEYTPAEAPRDWRWLLGLAGIVLAIDLGIDHVGSEAWAKVKQDIPKDAPVHVQVVAQQFSWDFVYPGKDGVLGSPDDLHSINELHLPVGVKVRLDLRSKDVIHSLFLPDSRFKQDLLPGREIPAWIEVSREGEQRLYCAELCGQVHTAMIGKLVAHKDMAAYHRWLKELAAL